VTVSPQDKAFWVEVGRDKKTEFVERILPGLGFDGSVNPAKAADPYAPDLIVEGHLADLKSQRMPFFKAREKYGVDPQFAVTFNEKDFLRYRDRYPSMDIYFWVVWQTCERTIANVRYSVRPMAGVWRASFPALRRRIVGQRW